MYPQELVKSYPGLVSSRGEIFTVTWIKRRKELRGIYLLIASKIFRFCPFSFHQPKIFIYHNKIENYRYLPLREKKSRVAK